MAAEVTGVDLLNAVKLRLAAQYAPRGWRSWIIAVAQTIESGIPFESAVSSLDSAAPRELRQLIVSALRVKDPMQLVLEALQARVALRSSWRELLSLMIYPIFSLAFATLVGTLFSFMLSRVIDLKYIEEFGLTGMDGIVAALQDQSQAIVGIGFIVGWTLITLATVSIVGPPWALTSIGGGIFLFGRPLRWINLTELLNRFGLFVKQGLSPVDAAAAVSESFANSGQRFASRAIEKRILLGMSLGNALAQSSLSDNLCRPVLRMLDYRGADLGRSLHETSHILQQLADRRCRSLSALMPMLVVFIVGTVIWGLISSYLLSLLPLLRMITSFA